MNRFLTKRRAKKAGPEPKRDLDLSFVLPPADDFRTSLIMPNLSARFSMLREQDDPKSKLGKASDDSVLYPKRQSRLHEFGFVSSTLADIAEVQSVRSAFKPPYADGSESRASNDSFATDDDASPGGSVMSRPRPFEGNVLFGGRQKVYKVSEGKSGGGLRGKAYYDDDVGIATFNKLQQEERERREQQSRMLLEKDDQDEETEKTAGLASSNTPSDLFSVQNFSRRRGTASSTTSTPSYPRSSTAATSIASQSTSSVSAPPVSSSSTTGAAAPAGLDRSFTKTRRLYEQGLEQHTQEQQSTATSRLNAMQKQRIFGAPGAATLPLSPSKSAMHLKERYNQMTKKPLPLAPEPLDSPSLSTISGTPKESFSSSSSPVQSHLPSPLSPVGSVDEHDPLYSALDPNDRGKATALGAFSKPQQQFDERQYLERQLEMQRQLQKVRQSRENSKTGVTPRVSPAQSLEEQRDDVVRDAETGHQIDTTPPKPAASAFSVFQSAAMRMRSPIMEKQTATGDSSAQLTFFGGDDSDVEVDRTPAPTVRVTKDEPQTIAASDVDSLPVRAPPPLFNHPALRSLSSNDLTIATEKSRTPRATLSLAVDDMDTLAEPLRPTENGEPVDSPTLGSNSTALEGLNPGGLGGLIRTHLRNRSGQSSIYSANDRARSMVEGVTLREVSGRQGQEGTPANSVYTHSNPWDLEELDHEYRTQNEKGSSLNLGEATRRSRIGYTTPQKARARQNSNPERDGAPEDGSYVVELRGKHTRDPSTETQAERDAFATELAQRQRAIQENLRVRAEIDARSPGPSPGSSGPTGALKALSLLRSKSSRDSMARSGEPTSKAMKMLGIDAASANTSSTSLNISIDADGSKQGLPRMWDSDDVRKTRSPPAIVGGSSRSRSNSEHSNGRSRSRPGRVRADSERAYEVIGAAYADMEPLAPPKRQFEQSAPNSPNSNRSRSNSRAAGYFDSAHLLQPAVPSPSLPSPGRPSPSLSQGGFSGASSPALSPRPGGSFFPPTSPRHTPVAIPYVSTLPVTNASTAGAAPVAPANIPAFNFSNRLRAPSKRHILKSDISEPLLISTTNVIDTIDLPPGASLKNGLDEVQSVPAARRKLFGFRRSHSEEDERPKRYGAAPPFGMNASPPKRVEGAMF